MRQFDSHNNSSHPSVLDLENRKKSIRTLIPKTSKRTSQMNSLPISTEKKPLRDKRELITNNAEKQ